MAGNAKEWCWNATGDKRYILGGGWGRSGEDVVRTQTRSLRFGGMPTMGFDWRNTCRQRRRY